MELDKSYKTKIDSQEQSKKIQELFFAQGGEWIDGGTEVDSDDLPPREYLCIEVNSKGKFIFGTYEKSYQSFDYKEITAPELIALLSQPENKETKMTNLSDFLKCKKVRCLSSNYAFVSPNKAYKLTGIKVVVIDEAGNENQYPIDDFEPVLETAIQATDSLDSTPMGTRTVNEPEYPRFEIGQKVYAPWLNDGEILTLSIDDNDDLSAMTKKGLQAFDCEGYAQNCTPRQPDLFHATQENHELLSKLMPWIDFEIPPKELTGSDLCRALVDKGKRRIYGYASNEKEMDLTGLETLCTGYCGDGFILVGYPVPVKYFVPANLDTGEPLTSEVLEK